MAQPTSFLNNLQIISGEISALIHTLKYERLQPSDAEFGIMEAKTQEVMKSMGEVVSEVQSLRERRSERTQADGRKLLSMADRTLAELTSRQLPYRQLRSRTAFSRNIRLIFTGPKESNIDSDNVKSRKRLLHDRCKRIRELGVDEIILWAATFTQTVWTPNILTKIVFDYVVEFIKLDRSQLWSPEIYKILQTLGEEEPLRSSRDFQDFLKEVNNRAEQLMATPSNQFASQAPTLNNAAQEVIETAFLVPASSLRQLIDLRLGSTDPNSIILTIPIEDRVATVVITISARRRHSIWISVRFTNDIQFKSSAR